MPPVNPERRRALADAALELLASHGAHGLSHRALDERAGLPAGTASNYFRSRDALFAAAVERVAALHYADMERASAQERTPVDNAALAELIGLSLLHSARLPERYLAIYELLLESRRRPALAEVFARMREGSIDFTLEQHRGLGLPTTRDQVRVLVTLYENALFGLLTGPPDEITEEFTHTLAVAMVEGSLPAADTR